MADLPILRLVTLDNFKSFRDRVDVPMGRGVNVIAGENGAGKSNLLDAVSFALGEAPANLRVKTMAELSSVPGRKVEVELQFELVVATDSVGSGELSTASAIKKAPVVLRLGSQIVDGCRYYLVNGSRAPRHRFEDAVAQHLHLNVGGQAVWRITQAEVNNKVCLAPSELFDALSQVSGTKLFNARREEALKQCAEFKLALGSVSADLGRLQAEVEAEKASVATGERRELLQLKLTHEIPAQKLKLEAKLAGAEARAHRSQAAATKRELEGLAQVRTQDEARAQDLATALEASAPEAKAGKAPKDEEAQQALKVAAAKVSAAKARLGDLERTSQLVEVYRATLPGHANALERYAAKKTSLLSRAAALRSAASVAKAHASEDLSGSDSALAALQKMASDATSEAARSSEAWERCTQTLAEARHRLEGASKALAATATKHAAAQTAEATLAKSIAARWQRFGPEKGACPSGDVVPTRRELEAALRDAEDQARTERAAIAKLETSCVGLGAELRCWLPATDDVNAPGQYLLQGIVVKDGEKGLMAAPALDVILGPHLGVRLTATTKDALVFAKLAKQQGRAARIWPCDRIDRPAGNLAKRRAELIKKALASGSVDGSSDPRELLAWARDDPAACAAVAKVLSNWVLAADDQAAAALLASAHGAAYRVVTKEGNQHSHGRLVGGGTGASTRRFNAASELQKNLAFLAALRANDRAEGLLSLRAAVEEAWELQSLRAQDHTTELSAASLEETKARAAADAATAALEAAATDRARTSGRVARAALATAQQSEGGRGKSRDAVLALLRSADADAEAAEGDVEALAEEEDALRDALRPKEPEVEERLVAADGACLASESSATVLCPWGLMRAGDAASAALSAETAAAKVELEALLAAKSAASAATAALAAQEDEQAQKRHEHRSLAQKLAHSIAAATAKMKALQTAVASLERAAAKAAAKATKGRNSFAEEEVGEAGGGCTVASVQKEVIGLLAEESAHRDELRALKGAKVHAAGEAAATSLANRGTLKAKVAKVATLQTQMASVSQAIEHLETGIGECAEVMRGANRKCFDQVSSSFATQVGQLCPGKTGLIEAVNPDDLADGLSLFVTAGDKRAERKSNVLELSGGQKALVGLALTFALSAHRRLPLYILDEIDAPLDEHNQAAAADAIAEVFRGSQVLCVSHHAPFHRKADHIIQISRQNEASKLMRCVDQTQGGTKRREAAGATTATASKRRLQ